MEPPERLIPKNQMVDILTDLTLINAAKITNIGVLRETNLEPMPYLFRKYGVDSIQFVESNRYYASLPMAYESIHMQVRDRIQNLQDTVIASKKVNDSLKLLEREAKKAKTAGKKKKSVIKKATDSLP